MHGIWLLMLFGNILAGFRPYGSKPSAPIYYYEQLEEAIRLQCRHVTGNDKAFRDLMSFRNHSVVKCIGQHVSCPEPKAFRLPYPYDEKFSVCGRIVDCIVPLVEKIKPCMYDKDSVRVVQTLMYSLPETLKKMCDQQLFQDLFKSRFESCVVKAALNINQCTYLIGNEWKAKAFEDYTWKECGEFINMKHCFNEMAKNCGRATEKLFHLLYFKVQSLTPCIL